MTGAGDLSSDVMNTRAEITRAIDDLDLVRAQLGEARTNTRSARFHRLVRARMQGADGRREHVADVIELSGGWSFVRWPHDPQSIALYSSSVSMRAALHVGVEVLLSLVDATERLPLQSDSRRQVPQALTKGEVEVLIGLDRGLSNQDIARHYGISESTVKQRLSVAYGKLNVQGRVQAALLVRDLQLSAPARTPDRDSVATDGPIG